MAFLLRNWWSGGSGFFIILILTTEARPQYVWNFSYITDKTTHWRHLASGDTVAIARLRFSKTVVTDPTEYRLTNFGTRPITNHINFGEQIIELTLQLWMDDGDTKFNPADSLLLTIDPLVFRLRKFRLLQYQRQPMLFYRIIRYFLL
jgi:hypothetical protein